MDLEIRRPEPVDMGIEMQSFGIKGAEDVEEALAALLEGKNVLIEGKYSNGLDLLHALQGYLKKMYTAQNYEEQRAYRAEYRKRSHQIMLKIRKHKLRVKKSPEIGWLEILYPEFRELMLTLPDVQGLNSSWQWYKKGVNVPVLRNKIHPYYGTYFPTRFEHLILFDNWLKRYEGPKKTAIDVGIGSGVLSMQLVKHGFQKSFGTDTNPNAIVGLKEFMGETKLSRKIELDYGHLFGKWEKPTELIVFNPPWLPIARESDRVDTAMYYDDKLFPEFFAEAQKRLLPDGKLVLLFSNIGQLTKATKVHPIEEELAKGGRYELELCLKKKVGLASKKTERDQYWRAEEAVELWVLKQK
ncbi:methyltransferase [Flammeovirgaceae bacterium SG7u.111]|nr:methyltransferase [Flammeovirgaceae bacterium SG7u.132]WPO37437.1 methyltransferase [Flammeovirgaceae bacterium SG7u.111]